MNPEKRECLPKIAFTGFKGRFVEPKVDEGFTDLIKVDFMVSNLRSYCFFKSSPSLLPCVFVGKIVHEIL